tara:strand:- start:648 stop:1040 length:393 start_codon:yes stop_codon:yes gene_type:complete
MANTGRDFLIKIAATAIAGAKTTGLSLDNSPIDITSLSSGGFRELANFSGVRSLDLSLSGVWADDTYRDLAFGAEGTLLLTDCTISFADGATLAGDFHVANYNETGSHDNAVEFDATLQSSGTFVLTTAV